LILVIVLASLFVKLDQHNHCKFSWPGQKVNAVFLKRRVLSAKMESNVTSWKSLYLVHFERALNEAFQNREDYKFLFTSEEIALSHPFFASENSFLSVSARGLFTRIFQRKGPWFRIESLIAYEELLQNWTENISCDEQMNRAQLALKELEAAGYLSGIKVGDASVPEDLAFEAIEACCRLDELRSLNKIFGQKGSSVLSRVELFRELQRGLRGQRNIYSYFGPHASGQIAGSKPLLAELCRILMSTCHELPSGASWDECCGLTDDPSTKLMTLRGSSCSSVLNCVKGAKSSRSMHWFFLTCALE